MKYNLYIAKFTLLRYRVWGVLTDIISSVLTILVNIENIVTTLQNSFVPFVTHPLPPTPSLRSHWLVSVSSFACSRMSCKWDHTACSVFCLLLSLTVNLVCSFPLPSGILSYGRSTVYPSSCWWMFALFPLLMVMNEAVVNIHIQFFVWTYSFTCPRLVSTSRVHGLFNKHLFKFVRNCQTFFQSGCT